MKKTKRKTYSFYDKKHWFRWFLIYGVLAIILYGGWYYSTLQKTYNQQQTPTDETANWKTYENSNNIFTFQYPATYVVRDPSKGVVHIASNEAMFTPRSQFITIDARLTGVYANYEQAVDVLLKQFKEDTTHRIKNNENKITITIGPYSLPAITNGPVLYGKIVYWKHKNGAVTAQYNNVTKNEANIYDQILSTFQFIQ